MFIITAVLSLLRSIRPKWLANHLVSLASLVSRRRLDARGVRLRWVVVSLVHVADWVLGLVSKQQILLVNIVCVSWWEDKLVFGLHFHRRRVVLHCVRLGPRICSRYFAQSSVHHIYVRLRTLHSAVQKFGVIFRSFVGRSATFYKYLLSESLDRPAILKFLSLLFSRRFNSLIGGFVKLSLVKHGDHASIFLPFSSEIVNEGLSFVKSRLLVLLE